MMAQKVLQDQLREATEWIKKGEAETENKWEN